MLLEGLRLGLAGLATNRLRSSLTMLGILIGVATVIVLVSLGNGVSKQVSSSLEGLGPDLLIVTPSLGGPGTGRGQPQPLTLADATAVGDQRLNPHVAAALPSAEQFGIEITSADHKWQTNVAGTTETMPQVRNMRVANGRFFSQSEVLGQSRVVVLGSDVSRRLFPGDEPVGKSVKIQGQSFRVIGRFASRGSAAGFNQDDVAAIPITTVWSYLDAGPSRQLSEIYVRASDARPSTVEKARGELTRTLLVRHRIADPNAADFQVLNPQDLLRATGQATRAVTIFLGAVAGISLLVGGIGIMNVMLITVLERTREIGVRKAVGARRSHILGQFLVESLFLSVLGGVLGITLGVLASWGLGRLFPPISPVVDVPILLLALTLALSVGLFFGIYPASRAARLDPIQALRYE